MFCGTGWPVEIETEGSRLCLVFKKRSSDFVESALLTHEQTFGPKDYVEVKNVLHDRPE